jgi:hypothetical protein
MVGARQSSKLCDSGSLTFRVDVCCSLPCLPFATEGTCRSCHGVAWALKIVSLSSTTLLHDATALTDIPNKIQEPRLWRDDGWTALVIKNEDDDGWAVAMTRDGAAEPALVGPWTMGRDKKNPKPLDGNAFNTLVKTASEFVRRQEQQLHAALHQSITVTAQSARVTVCLDIVPDEDNPYAVLSAKDEGDELLAEQRVAPSFKLNRSSAVAWVEAGFATAEGRNTLAQ